MSPSQQAVLDSLFEFLRIPSVSTDPNHKADVLRAAHFSADAVRRLYANFADGMVGEYLDNRTARDAKLSLISMEARR